MQSWYDEVKDYTYPYPHECNPWCPERCSGPMCTHYTQVSPEALAATSAQHPQTPSLTLQACSSVESLHSLITIMFPFNLVFFKVRLSGRAWVCDTSLETGSKR